MEKERFVDPDVALRPDCYWNLGTTCPMQSKHEKTYCDECNHFRPRKDEK